MTILTKQETDQVQIAGSFWDFIYIAAANGCRCSLLLRKYLQYPTLRRRLLSIGNYFAIRENGKMISYTPPGKKPEMTENGTWSRKGRQSMKAGKFIQTLLPTVKAADVENFASHLRQQVQEYTVTFENDIEAIYREASAVVSSCMVGDPINDFYQAFGCKAAAVRDESGQVRARAIFWPDVYYITEHGDDTAGFIDRIYGDSDAVRHLIQYAEDKGYLRRADNSCNDETVITSTGEYVDTIEVSTKNSVYGLYAPYLDTLKYYRREDGQNIVSNKEAGHDVCLRETDGSGLDYDPQSTVTLVNGDEVDEDDAVYISFNNSSRYDGYYLYDDTTECVNGTRYPDQYVEQTSDGNYVCPIDDATDGYILCEDGTWYPQDDVFCVDDEFYHRSEVAEVETGGETIYVLKSNIREL